MWGLRRLRGFDRHDAFLPNGKALTRVEKNHQVIRHAYENVLTACARLSSFATAKPTDSIDNLINARQTILATDDLMAFAINARRLMDNGASLDQFANAIIKVTFNDIDTVKPVTRIVNILIHHNDIRIIRFNYELMVLDNPIGGSDFDAQLFLHKNVKSFPPIVRVKSDQNKRVIFDVAELIHVFESKVLAPIVEICAEDKLYLDDDI